MENVLKNHKIDHFGCVSFQHLNTFDVRSKAKIPPDCQGAIAIIFPYYNKSATLGNVSAYCAVEDYHLVVGMKLKSICEDLKSLYPDYNFVPFVDASPIDEVDLCVKAGLGIKGKNSLLITPWYGSFVFIGEVLTDMPLDTVLFSPDFCIDCGACAKACPGGAIGEGGILKERCASFISQKKGELTQEQTQILTGANTVFGCDICQMVCPYNKPLLTSALAMEKNLFSENIVNRVDKQILEGEYKSRAFGFRGEKVLQRNLQLWEKHNL